MADLHPSDSVSIDLDRVWKSKKEEGRQRWESVNANARKGIKGSLMGRDYWELHRALVCL